jgi:hypothetical protein
VQAQGLSHVYVPFVDIDDEPEFGTSGIEWRAGGSNLGYRAGAMQGNAPVVDFYVTNFAESSGGPYYFVSPDLAGDYDSDAALVSRVEGLKQARFLDLGTDSPNYLSTAVRVWAHLVPGSRVFGLETSPPDEEE